MSMAASVVYNFMIYDAMKCFLVLGFSPPCNVYAYFLCRLVCTCIHESDAKLTCMCFS